MFGILAKLWYQNPEKNRLVTGQVAATSQKRAKLNLLMKLSDAVSKEQAEYDLLFGDASSVPRSLQDYLALTQVLADLGDFNVASATLQIGRSGANVLVAYADLGYGKLALEQLNRLGASKAQALATLDSKVKADVHALQSAKATLQDCSKHSKTQPPPSPPTGITVTPR